MRYLEICYHDVLKTGVKTMEAFKSEKKYVDHFYNMRIVTKNIQSAYQE